MYEELEALLSDNAALERIEYEWLIKWHQQHGFSAERPAEQWLTVILEYLREQEDKDPGP